MSNTETKSKLQLVEVTRPNLDRTIEMLEMGNGYYNAPVEKIRDLKTKADRLEDMRRWNDEGFRTIDMVSSILKTGGPGNGTPYIAICRLVSANNQRSYFDYYRAGIGCYRDGDHDDDAILWIHKPGLPHRAWDSWNYPDAFVTQAPLVLNSTVKEVKEIWTAHKSTVTDSRVLLAWETHDWKQIPKPDYDPLILVQMGPESRYAAILKAWDISEVEHAFMQYLAE